MSETTHAEHPKDYSGAKLGMWLFLFTEVLLFGGLFILYAVYLQRYPEGFKLGGDQLNVWFGGGNTLVLLTSSLSVAMAITALQRGRVRQAANLVGVTVIMALWFLVNKFFEWSAKIHHGIYPSSGHLKEMPGGEQVFFNIYYLTTGLHGIHVLVGMFVMTWVLILIRKGKVNPDDYVTLENAGLYWHLVDLIWIFIFPLYYLIL
ncbi:cytochrome C oxidase subunit III [Geothermobacter hydrogeniphilus]|uniref:Cytochrome C oxidase subunit III n=1 Tax=Geothermobacter hydrogeniphilus TaxID=1969733 RepID=A0A2K2HDS0_9BACT|nr:cytochrome c oxidase subunit 3 family protein [Geothermobacter hydrogeniphilus]PNU21399.1 cytochrome C oxidase subunit III [Geothermobacter hydrogeniphilus]